MPTAGGGTLTTQPQSTTVVSSAAASHLAPGPPKQKMAPQALLKKPLNKRLGLHSRPVQPPPTWRQARPQLGGALLSCHRQTSAQQPAVLGCRALGLQLQLDFGGVCGPCRSGGRDVSLKLQPRATAACVLCLSSAAPAGSRRVPPSKWPADHSCLAVHTPATCWPLRFSHPLTTLPSHQAGVW